MMLSSRRFSRQGFLRAALGAGMTGATGLLLAACSPAGPSTAPTTAAAQQPTAKPAAAATTQPTAAATQPTAAATAKPAAAATAQPAATAPAAQAATTINLWKAPHKPAGEEVKIADKVLASFHDKNPSITAQYREVPWDKYGQALTAAFASNDPPDVSYQTEGISAYVLPGKIEALDDRLREVAGLKDKFYPQTLIPGTINGKLYGIPWVNAGNVQLWNKDLFEKNGLDPEKPPATWDDVVTIGKKLTKPDANQYGFMVGGKTALEFHGWNHVFWPINGGGKWTNEDFTEIYLDQPPAIQAAQFFSDLFNVHKITPPPDLSKVTGQLMSMFQAGKGGFAWEVNTAIGTIKDAKVSFKLGVGPKPKGPATSDDRHARAGYGSVGYAAMSSGSKQKDASWTLTQFLIEPDSLKGWISLLGWQPVLKGLSFADGDPIIEAAEANLGNSMVENEYMPDRPYRNDVMTEFLNQYDAIAGGRRSASDAMVQGSKNMRDLIAARKSG